MTDGSTIKLAVAISIGLVILFLMVTTLIMPYFSNAYEYGFGTQPCAKTGCVASSSANSLVNSYCTQAGGITACTDCNNTAGYSSFLSTCYSIPAWNNATHCTACANFGFKTVSTGLMLFILVIGLIFFGIVFLKATKFGKK